MAALRKNPRKRTFDLQGSQGGLDCSDCTQQREELRNVRQSPRGSVWVLGAFVRRSWFCRTRVWYNALLLLRSVRADAGRYCLVPKLPIIVDRRRGRLAGHFRARVDTGDTV